MKVGVFASSATVGGAEHWLRRLVVELARQGEDVTAITGEAEAVAALLAGAANVEHVRLPLREVAVARPTTARLDRRPGEVLRSIQLARRLTSLPHNRRLVRVLLATRTFDVLHISNGGYPGSFAALGAILEGVRAAIPIVHTIHAPPRPRLRLLGVVERRLDSAVTRAAGATTTVATANVPLLERRGIGPPIHVIPPGLRAPAMVSQAAARAHLGVPPWRIVIGMIGRMSWPKRQDEVVRVIRSLADRGIDAGALLAGIGPAADGVAALARELGVADRIMLLGERDRYDVLPALNALVHLSDSEGAPLTIIEALSCGVPVVAWDVGGVAELIADATCVLPHGNVDAIVDRLAEMSQAADHIIDNARTTALHDSSRFSLEATAARYREIYASVRP